MKYGRQRWKLKGRIEANGKQSWDGEEVVFLPLIVGFISIKVQYRHCHILVHGWVTPSVGTFVHDFRPQPLHLADSPLHPESAVKTAALAQSGPSRTGEGVPGLCPAPPSPTDVRPSLSLSHQVTELKGLATHLLVGSVTCETKELFAARPQVVAVDINDLGTIKLSLEITW